MHFTIYVCTIYTCYDFQMIYFMWESNWGEEVTLKTNCSSPVVSFFYPLKCWHIFVVFEPSLPFCSKENFQSQLLSRAGRKNETLGTLHWRMGKKIKLHDLWSFCREVNTDPNENRCLLDSICMPRALCRLISPEVKSLQSAYVTTGAVSQECLHMPSDCNICSAGMSPLPYSQTPGNMWAALWLCCSTERPWHFWQRHVASPRWPERNDVKMQRSTRRIHIQQLHLATWTATWTTPQRFRSSWILRKGLTPKSWRRHRVLNSRHTIGRERIVTAGARLCRDASRNIASSMAQNQQIGAAGFFSRPEH